MGAFLVNNNSTVLVYSQIEYVFIYENHLQGKYALTVTVVMDVWSHTFGQNMERSKITRFNNIASKQQLRWLRTRKPLAYRVSICMNQSVVDTFIMSCGVKFLTKLL